MGRYEARVAIQQAIQGANIPFVGTVFPARPTIVQEEDYDQTIFGQYVQPSVNGSTAVIIVNMPGNDKRMRRADVGRGAVNDTWIMPVILEIFFASTGGDATQAQMDYDQIVDALVIFIRNNATMNVDNGAVVWSAGEFTYGVQHQMSEPLTDDDGLTVFIVGGVKYECWQWLAGQGV